jgi:cytochrome c biogenesis factor
LALRTVDQSLIVAFPLPTAMSACIANHVQQRRGQCAAKTLSVMGTAQAHFMTLFMFKIEA